MTNLELSNKRTVYTVKAEETNVSLQGVVTISENLKVSNFIGQIIKDSQVIGSFNYDTNVNLNLMQNKECLSEASQLLSDILAGIETELNA